MQGYTKFPYAWQPDIVDIQMMRVGQFVVLVVPGEFTTMAGRRLRQVDSGIELMFLIHILYSGNRCVRS